MLLRREEREICGQDRRKGTTILINESEARRGGQANTFVLSTVAAPECRLLASVRACLRQGRRVL